MKKNTHEEYTQLTFFEQASNSLNSLGKKIQEPKKNIDDCKIQSKNINPDDFYMEEVEYTEKEKAEVIKQIQSVLWLHKLGNKTTKKKLKSWFADVAMQHFGDYCPNITGKDLCDIAKEIGIEVIE